MNSRNRSRCVDYHLVMQANNILNLRFVCVCSNLWQIERWTRRLVRLLVSLLTLTTFYLISCPLEEVRKRFTGIQTLYSSWDIIEYGSCGKQLFNAFQASCQLILHMCTHSCQIEVVADKYLFQLVWVAVLITSSSHAQMTLMWRIPCRIKKPPSLIMSKNFDSLIFWYAHCM